MRTIALRFGEQFAPKDGTIEAHQQLIDVLGYVWYGKMGCPVSASIIETLKKQEDTKILLISSGKSDRYWAHITDISKITPPKEGIPEYYREFAGTFKTWFKITEFEHAPKDIMKKCFVVSSGNVLCDVSKHSMSPYFIIDYKENEVM